MENALHYAKELCNTMMRKFEAKDIPPVGRFHYHQGVFLSGMSHVYEVCGEEKYCTYIKNWVDSLLCEDGSILNFDRQMLDNIQPGILLFDLYRRTGDCRYKTALDMLMSVLRDWPCNPVGGFWHTETFQNEMWLDGLYMAGPLEARYSAEFGDASFIDTAVRQIIIMRDNMQDKQTKLLYHAWDYFKRCSWANKETGLSPEFWGRALGWYVVAILDILEFLPEDHPKRQEVIGIEREVLAAIAGYQDAQSGMWYQVVDKGGYDGNWLESSCSSLFSYALAKAVRMGFIDKTYLDAARRGFEGVIRHSVTTNGEDLLIQDICIGTCVCNYEKYISRPTSMNDLHGAGAFLLMCAELAREDAR